MYIVYDDDEGGGLSDCGSGTSSTALPARSARAPQVQQTLFFLFNVGSATAAASSKNGAKGKRRLKWSGNWNNEFVLSREGDPPSHCRPPAADAPIVSPAAAPPVPVTLSTLEEGSP